MRACLAFHRQSCQRLEGTPWREVDFPGKVSTYIPPRNGTSNSDGRNACHGTPQRRPIEPVSRALAHFCNLRATTCLSYGSLTLRIETPNRDLQDFLRHILHTFCLVLRGSTENLTTSGQARCNEALEAPHMNSAEKLYFKEPEFSSSHPHNNGPS